MNWWLIVPGALVAIFAFRWYWNVYTPRRIMRECIEQLKREGHLRPRPMPTRQ